MASMDDALLMNLLKQADVTVTEDGNSLEIMVKSISGTEVWLCVGMSVLVVAVFIY